MKPFGRIKHIVHFFAKRDYHCHDKNHRKVGSWWEEYETTVPRTTLKQIWKRKIENDD